MLSYHIRARLYRLQKRKCDIPFILNMDNGRRTVL